MAAIKYFGASVLNFSSRIGWNIGSPSELNVRLVENTGDAFTFPSSGQPTYFEVEGFKFGGIVQRSVKNTGQDGNPVYDVTAVDPRAVLDACTVIISDYADGVNIPNILNAYGFYENQGFGASLTNEVGMPWQYIANAVTAMTFNAIGTAFGGPLSYRGYGYSVDLSQLPVPPLYYRLPGPTINLLEAIAAICEDGACNFFVELVGQTIRIRTVSKLLQPPLGTIGNLVESNAIGQVIRSSHGVENANEITSSFLIGGNVQKLHIQDEGIVQFWGYDVDGNPILGRSDTFEFLDKNGSVTQTVDCEFMELNAAPVADVVGDTAYGCSTVELRLAKESYAAWAAYIIHYKPKLADVIGIGLTSPLKTFDGLGDNPTRTDITNDEPDLAVNMAIAVSTDQHVKEMRLYEFVRSYAEEYLGRKFLIPLPLLLDKQDPDTLRTYYNYDIAQNGGYLPEGSAPLGLSELNEDIFRSPEGLFACFTRFDSVEGVDLSLVNPQGTALEDNVLFMVVNVDPRILTSPSPYALVTLPAPVLETAVSPLGDPALLWGAFQMNDEAQLDAINERAQFSNLGVRCAPDHRVPTAVAVPLRSNVLTYGPWYALGAPGKVKVDVDPNMVPWNFGGFEEMALAGQARVGQAVSNLTEVESAFVEVVGVPARSLGEVLTQGGPNITGVDVSLSSNGIVTTYQFSTYTPRFGVFGKNNFERIHRIGTANRELRRAQRAVYREALAKGEIVQAAAAGASNFFEHAPPSIKRQSPHDVLVGYNLDTGSGVRVGVASATYEEAVAFTNADDDESFRATSTMSMAGLVRPFCTANGSGNGMASYEDLDLSVKTFPHVHSLDPWKAHNDIEVYLWGSGYAGLHAYRRGATGENARPMGLRGPAVLNGWGYSVEGKCVPASGDGTDWDSDYLTNCKKWKVGPVDTLWDENRGVWTTNPTYLGTIQGDIGPNASGVLHVTPLQGDSYDLTVWNKYSGNLDDGWKAMATFVANEGKLCIFSANCPG